MTMVLLINGLRTSRVSDCSLNNCVFRKALYLHRLPQRVLCKEMMAAVENSVQKLSEKDAASVRPKIVSIFSQCRPPVLNLSAAEQVPIKQLRYDDTIHMYMY